jgi:hypothetical protein
MKRRNFLAASLAASALALARKASPQSAPAAVQPVPAATPRDYYQIRRYQMRSGPQTALTQTYFADALIPALSRLGLGPEGGAAGTRIVAQGTPEQIAANLLSHTGQWLARVL